MKFWEILKGVEAEGKEKYVPVIKIDKGHRKENVDIVRGIVGKDVLHPNKGTNTVRAVFAVDPQGIIRAMLYYPQELVRNMDEILGMVRGHYLKI